ncbi:secreted protein containing S-layer homology region domain protein [Candidatus Magnetoovum chiemensis]|nr:secreted protein containing S-layer homology region domain protein [Candidatus Magnetoovum chiemensis]
MEAKMLNLNDLNNIFVRLLIFCCLIVCFSNSTAYGQDEYEPDDEPHQASVINIDEEEKRYHDFHQDGDTDWIMFYATGGRDYTIEISDPQSNIDPIVELYYENDLTSAIDIIDDGQIGEEESRSWRCQADGFYYLKVYDYDNTYGDNTGYYVDIYEPTLSFTSKIKGVVYDTATGKPIYQAFVDAGAGGNPANSLSNGSYVTSCDAGDWVLTATKSGYNTYTKTITVGASETIVENIYMQSTSSGQCSSSTCSLSQDTVYLVSNSGANSVNVSAPTDYTWSATSNASWITITSGTSGTGSGTVSYSVSKNSSIYAREGTITIAQNTYTVKQAGYFYDALDLGEFTTAIELIYAYGITSGCNVPAVGYYCPDDSVTRAQMALFIIRALGLEAEIPSTCSGTLFKDVNASTIDLYFCRAIEMFSELGITSGYEDGTFGHNDSVTRAQMAVFIDKAYGLDPWNYSCNGIFNDVSANDDYFCRAIELFSTQGLTSGCGNNNFCPDENVTREQMAMFLAKGRGLL